MPTAEDFRQELFRIIAAAQKSGSRVVEINAGALHRRLGGYPGADSRMPKCCQVMKAQLALDLGDVVLHEPPSGQGATLTIRYRLPRPESGDASRDEAQPGIEKPKRGRKFKLRLWGSRQ
jgi:5-methylcytosine-specific restriction protein A